MSDCPPYIRAFLEKRPHSFEVIAVDPSLSDTTVFCEHYGYALLDSANTIVVRSKTGELKYAACVVLATDRLDVNKVVRKKLGARKVSFAAPDEAFELTGMELGGVTAFCLPADLPLWIDGRVMTREKIILGGGNRGSKIIVPPQAISTLVNAEIVDGLAIAPSD